MANNNHPLSKFCPTKFWDNLKTHGETTEDVTDYSKASASLPVRNYSNRKIITNPLVQQACLQVLIYNLHVFASS